MTRSESLKQQWRNGKRITTIISLKKTYSDNKLKTQCSDNMKRFFSNPDNKQKHLERTSSNVTRQKKSNDMKKWWAKPANRAKMLKIMRNDENKTKISMMMALKKKGLNVYTILNKMNIPYKKRYKEAFHTFDALLYPDSEERILLDARKDTEDMQRNAKAKEIFVKALMPGFRYVWISDVNEKRILEII